MIDSPQTNGGKLKTAFRGKYIENEPPESVECLFEMMLAAKKQINLRRAISHENRTDKSADK